MRRNDFDVTDTIRTTDPVAVRAAVEDLYRKLYPKGSVDRLERMFSDLLAMYNGEDKKFLPCDTEYHDIQHVLDVSLAMARLMDGYERHRRSGEPPVPSEVFELGIALALFHDQGYLRRRNDRRHRYGAEYTLTHVSRGARFLRGYLPARGMPGFADTASKLVHFTGYERPANTIPVSDPLMRRIGYMLGTADIVAQMSDRCYLEKCRDRLFPEFVLGGLAKRTQPDGSVKVIFTSGQDLVHKTPGFYQNATKRLNTDLASAHEYAERHFDGENLYLQEMDKNVDYARMIDTTRRDDMLRRTLPSTLHPDVEPYPEDLVIR